MLPNALHGPTPFLQRAVDQLVSQFISGELFPPECSVAGGLRRVLRAAVPKAAVHEHREAMLWKHKIGIPEHASVATPASDVVTAE